MCACIHGNALRFVILLRMNPRCIIWYVFIYVSIYWRTWGNTCGFDVKIIAFQGSRLYSVAHWPTCWFVESASTRKNKKRNLAMDEGWQLSSWQSLRVLIIDWYKNPRMHVGSSVLVHCIVVRQVALLLASFLFVYVRVALLHRVYMSGSLSIHPSIHGSVLHANLAYQVHPTISGSLDWMIFTA